MKVGEKKEGRKEIGRGGGRKQKKALSFTFTLFSPSSGPICSVYTILFYSIIITTGL